MEKVLGFGGFFFRAEDPATLAVWYRDNLGIDLVPNDYETPCWTQEAGETVFAPFEKVTEYFGNQEKHHASQWSQSDRQLQTIDEERTFDQTSRVDWVEKYPQKLQRKVHDLIDESFSGKSSHCFKQIKKLTQINRIGKKEGGLVMPVILEWTFEDGTTEIERIPVEIWRKNENQFTKVFVKEKEVTSIRLDPFKETADIDESNNNWPVRELPSRFQVFKQHKVDAGPNPMQKAKKKGIKP